MRILLTLAMLCAVVTSAHAGSIRGHVAVPSAPPAEARFKPYAGRASSLASPERPQRGLVTDAVLYIDTLVTEPSHALPLEHPKLAQKGQAFEPRVVVVQAGGTVDFPNLDPIYHNVFSVSPTRRFDLGKYPRGQSRSITFHKPGLVNVFCDIHSDMAAFILVVPNRHFTHPAADGGFELSGLPPGRYHVRAWHPDFPARDLEVVVPASGDATQDVGF